jgi:hypothetical protein
LGRVSQQPLLLNAVLLYRKADYDKDGEQLGLIFLEQVVLHNGDRTHRIQIPSRRGNIAFLHAVDPQAGMTEYV